MEITTEKLLPYNLMRTKVTDLFAHGDFVF